MTLARLRAQREGGREEATGGNGEKRKEEGDRKRTGRVSFILIPQVGSFVRPPEGLVRDEILDGIIAQSW